MTAKAEIEETLKLWYSVINELDGMKDFLSADKINNQFYRRLFLKNVFSIIETYIFVTKELVRLKLDIGNDHSQISWSEIAVLHEKRVSLDQQGRVELKDDFQRLKPSLRFSLNIFCKVFGSDPPSYGDSNFEKFGKLSERRNDITHPKSWKKLTITSQEVKDTISMLWWFIQTHNDISKGFLNWFESLYKSEN